MTAVQRSEWSNFARRFSKGHDGWSASLRVLQAPGGFELAVEDRPFRGLTFETRPAETLILSFGDEADEHLAHVIESPQDIGVVDDGSSHCSLVVGSADGFGCVLDLEDPAFVQ